MRLATLRLVTLAALFGGAARVNAGYFVVGLSAPGATSTSATAINDSGQVVGSAVVDGSYYGFMYSGGSGGAYTMLSVPGSTLTTPNAINAAGQIVGIFTNGAVASFLYSGGVYTTINVPGSGRTDARAINTQGEIAGDFRIGSENYGFFYSGGAYTTIHVPGSTFTSITGLNSTGEVIGYYHAADGVNHGFYYAGGVYTTLSLPGVDSLIPEGINSLGQIVGQTRYGGTPAGFIYNGGDYTTLQSLTIAEGINESGVVVGNSPGVTPGQGFVYSGGVYTTMSVPGSTSTNVWAINALGELAGDYSFGGINYGFVALPGDSGFQPPPDIGGSGSTVAPAPSSFTLLVIGIATMAGYGWRRKYPKSADRT
jgi:hypothetical protein